MEREDKIGLGKVTTASRKQKEDDPLPFLREPTSTSRFGSGTTSQPLRKRLGPSGSPMDKIFRQGKREENNLTIDLNFI